MQDESLQAVVEELERVIDDLARDGRRDAARRVSAAQERLMRLHGVLGREHVPKRDLYDAIMVVLAVINAVG